jgi:hypothetical protein
MSGTSQLADHLGTPKALKELRDAIESTGPADMGTPRKLEKIMDSKFSRHEHLSDHDDSSKIAKHFGDDKEGASGAWNAGRTQHVTLPMRRHRLSARHVHDADSDRHRDESKSASFEGLLSTQIGAGRHALRERDLRRATKALKQASFFLKTVEDKNAGHHVRVSLF